MFRCLGRKAQVGKLHGLACLIDNLCIDFIVVRRKLSCEKGALSKTCVVLLEAVNQDMAKPDGVGCKCMFFYRVGKNHACQR